TVRAFAPVLGTGIDRTNVPVGVYSSKKTGVAVVPMAALPSPTRKITRLLGRIGCAAAEAEKPAMLISPRTILDHALVIGGPPRTLRDNTRAPAQVVGSLCF